MCQMGLATVRIEVRRRGRDGGGVTEDRIWSGRVGRRRAKVALKTEKIFLVVLSQTHTHTQTETGCNSLFNYV